MVEPIGEIVETAAVFCCEWSCPDSRLELFGWRTYARPNQPGTSFAIGLASTMSPTHHETPR